MFWNSRYQNTMSAANTEASSSCASFAANTDITLTVDAMLMASILVILGLVCLSLTAGVVISQICVLVLAGILGIMELNRRGRDRRDF